MFLRNLTNKSTGACLDKLGRLKAILNDADAVIIGAGSGLSAAAGFTYSGERFDRYFHDFAEKYHIRDIYSGGFYPFDSLEEYWAWWSRRDCPKCGKPMTVNLRSDNTFVEDKGWHTAQNHYGISLLAEFTRPYGFCSKCKVLV